jgi:hypothetical protein
VTKIVANPRWLKVNAWNRLDCVSHPWVCGLFWDRPIVVPPMQERYAGLNHGVAVLL